MRPLRTRLQEARQRLGIPWEILERDYLLSWILAGIGQVPELCDTLVCKGGTALKKCVTCLMGSSGGKCRYIKRAKLGLGECMS